MIVKVRRDNDPFKKYWWVLLAGFGLVGGWICLPLMDSGTGSSAVARDQGLKSADQSLDSVDNPHGAPGGAVDLSMDGTGAYKKKSGGAMSSSLYEPPPDASSSTAALSGGSASSLANALKDITRKSASTAADPSGWGGQKAQKGFTAPKAGFGSMSGFGGGSASGASSGGGSSAGGSGMGAFGTANAKTGITTTKGLGAADAGAGKGGKPVMNALNSASQMAMSAASQKSFDASASMAGGSFDGGGGAKGISTQGGGASTIGGGGMYGKLDSAPINLKANDPNLSKKELAPPPAKPVEPKKESMQEMIMKMILTAVIGGVVNGVVGAVFGSASGGGKS